MGGVALLSGKPCIEFILNIRKKDCEESLVLASVNVLGLKPVGTRVYQPKNRYLYFAARRDVKSV